MASDFDIRHFFRRAPRYWLERYFEESELVTNFDWSSLGKRKINSLLKRWAEIELKKRLRAVEDFRNIKLLATPACKVQIIDEAAFRGIEEEVGAKLVELGDFYACAFWVLLEHRRSGTAPFALPRPTGRSQNEIGASASTCRSSGGTSETMTHVRWRMHCPNYLSAAKAVARPVWCTLTGEGQMRGANIFSLIPRTTSIRRSCSRRASLFLALTILPSRLFLSLMMKHRH